MRPDYGPASMVEWEYKTISTFKSAGGTTNTDMHQAVWDVVAEIQQAGAEGWEAVAPVAITVREAGYTGPGTGFPLLLLKRLKQP